MNFIRLFRNLTICKDERRQQIAKCDDVGRLADMYGDARHYGDHEEMKIIDERLAVVIRNNNLDRASKGANHG